jgi:DNA helicase-2/ATP-dependent DNA helicase PcrA
LEEKIELDLAKGMISKRKNQGITPQKYATMTKFPTDDLLLEIYKAYEKELVKSNMMDFDDLLLQPYLLLREHGHILEKRQSKFQHILVDEAQDTNRIQFELMKLLT